MRFLRIFDATALGQPSNIMNKIMIYNEDHTAAVLSGLPLFCVGREYETSVPSVIHKIQYRFSFPNGYSASVVEFVDKVFSGGEQYELAVLHVGEITYTTSVSMDIERGNEKDICRLLTDIEAL